MQETAFEHDRGRHTLQPSWTTPVGALANQTHSRGTSIDCITSLRALCFIHVPLSLSHAHMSVYAVRETRSISPPTVRKIVSSQLTGGSDSR